MSPGLPSILGGIIGSFVLISEVIVCALVDGGLPPVICLICLRMTSKYGDGK